MKSIITTMILTAATAASATTIQCGKTEVDVIDTKIIRINKTEMAALADAKRMHTGAIAYTYNTANKQLYSLIVDGKNISMMDNKGQLVNCK